jgi:hypothetical protein
MDAVWVEKRPRRVLTHEQKIAFVLLCVLGGGGVILGILSFGANVRRPFETQLARYTGEQILTGSQLEAREREAQKTRDSDKDGLSDYDELYVYKTSAYLADSDSDGTDDRTEVFAGTDPNCPTGRDCGNYVLSPEATGARPLPPAPQDNSVKGLLNLQPSSPQEIFEYLEGLSNDQIRQILIQQGVPEEDVNKLTDEELRELVNKAILELNAQAAAAEAANAPQETQPAPNP